MNASASRPTVDIFISYAHQDSLFAKQLAEALESEGWSTWWDTKIRAGQQWDDMIDEKLHDARSVVVLWSQSSVKSRWVKNEARFAQNKHVLVPLFIDDVTIPLEFSDLQSIFLAHWAGDKADPGFRQLVESISSALSPNKKATSRVDPASAKISENMGLAEAGVFIHANPDILPDLAVFRDLNSSWCPKMVALPKGELMMGSPDSDEDAYPDEKPRHRVAIGYRLALGQYLVTFAEYDTFAKATGRDYPGDATWGRASHPVINVTCGRAGRKLSHPTLGN